MKERGDQKMIKIEKAGNVEYNNLNCRLRTALKSKNGDIYYLEVSTGHQKIGKEAKHYIFINFLFRVNEFEEARNSFSFDLNNNIVKKWNTNKYDYTLNNIKKLLNTLNIDLTNKEIVLTNYHDYNVHAENIENYDSYKSFKDNYYKRFIIGN